MVRLRAMTATVRERWRSAAAIGSFALLLAAVAADAQVTGSAPVNWGDDPSTVALWTFNGNANNVSNSRTYCAAGEADLSRFVGQSGGLSFDSNNRREGSASVSLDGGTTLAAMSSINDTACLRGGSPDQWTMTFWIRNTALNNDTSSPFPMIIFNRDESASGSGALSGFYVTYINDGGSTEGRTYACTRASGENTDTCTPFIASALSPSTDWHFGAVSTPAPRSNSPSRPRRSPTVSRTRSARTRERIPSSSRTSSRRRTRVASSATRTRSGGPPLS